MTVSKEPRKRISKEHRKKMSEAMKKLWTDPEFRQKMIDGKKTKAYSKKRSKIAKRTWMTTSIRKRRIKGITYNWAINEERKESFSKLIKKLRKKEKLKCLKHNRKSLFIIEKRERIRNYGGVVEDSSLRNE